MCRLSVFAVALLVVTLAGCGDGDSAREDGLRTVDRRLLAAAYANDVRAARRLIDAGGDVNAKDETEQSALPDRHQRGPR